MIGGPGFVATHILLQVFLPLLERRLAELLRKLRRRVVHELAVLPKHVPRLAAGLLLPLLLLLLLLVRAAVVAL
jgi:hypothetical protein